MNFLNKTLKEEGGCNSLKVIRAPENYFEMSLEERKNFLDAPSTAHLCKTIIMQNSRHQLGVDTFPDAKDDSKYPKNIIVIT